MTHRKRAIDAVKALLDGNTSAGARVYRGRTLFDDDDLFPAISIMPGDGELIDKAGERVKVELPIAIQAVDAADLAEPGANIEAILGEIKTALFAQGVELDDEITELAYTGDGAYEREEGSKYISAAVNVSLFYVEHLGAPNS